MKISTILIICMLFVLSSSLSSADSMHGDAATSAKLETSAPASRGLSAEELAWMQKKTKSASKTKGGTGSKAPKLAGAAGGGGGGADSITAELERLIVNLEREVDSEQNKVDAPRVQTKRASESASAVTSSLRDDAPLSSDVGQKEFDALLRRVRSDNIMVFVLFYAHWCNHCRLIRPHWERLAAFYERDPRVVFVTVNAEGKGDKLMSRYKIQGVPNLLLFTPSNVDDDGEMYKGKRTFEVLQKWLQDRVGSPAIAANSLHSEYHRRLNQFNKRQHPDRVMDEREIEQLTMKASKAAAKASSSGSTAATKDTSSSSGDNKASSAKAKADAEAETARRTSTDSVATLELPDESFEPSDVGVFVAANNERLAFRSWELEEQDAEGKDDDKHVVLLLHGLGEHSACYQTIVDALYPTGVTFYAYDMRGHGLSPGVRGDADSWSLLRDDLSAFIKFVQRRENVQRVTLLGHDVGALLALDYALFRPKTLRGVIGYGTRFEAPRNSDVPDWLASTLHVVWPSFGVQTDVQVEDHAADITIGRQLHEDALHHNFVSVRLRDAIDSIAATTLRYADSLRTPVLLVHGSADRLAPVDAVREFIDAATRKTSLATLLVVNGARHRVFDEPEFGLDSLKSVRNWLDGVAQ